MSKLIIEPHEFTKYRWVTPQEAFDLYCQEKVPMLWPQLIALILLMQNKTLDILKKRAQTVYDLNICSYSSISIEQRDLSKIPASMRSKAVTYFCNEHDLKSDSDRPNLNVLVNPNFREENERIGKSKRNFEELAQCYEGMLIGTIPGDFFDMNDGYPILSRKDSRLRVYITLSNKLYWEIIRFEYT